MKKSTKLMLAAGLLSAGFASAASAQTADVYITGSSAYRAAVTNAMARLLTNPQGSFVGTTGAGALAGSNQQLIFGKPNATGTTNGLTAGTTYYFHTCWTGSVAGIISLTDNVPASPPSGVAHAYLPDSVGGSAVTPASTSTFGAVPQGGTGVAASAATQDNATDGIFSDVFQSSTKFNRQTLTAANNGKNTDGIVGVVPFVFVANPDLTSYVVAAGATTNNSNVTNGRISNISATNATALYSGGVDLAQLTGDPNDDANEVGNALAVGRNFDSGTRFTTFAETGFNPVGGQQPNPVQYAVSGTAPNVSVTLYPAETLFPGTSASTSFSAGQSGYASGGNERTALAIAGTSTSPTNPSYIIGTLGESDAIKIVNVGSNAPSYLAYNGVNYASNAATTPASPFNRTLLDQGLYTLWGYEHAYYLNTAHPEAVNALATDIRNNDAILTGEFISNMAVQRTVEGGPISYVGTGQSTE